MEIRARAALLSVGSNTLLVLAKAAVGIAIGSVSIVSEAIHSGLDLVAALMALLAVRMAAMPPDEQHRYGHGKIENVSGTVEAILILVAAVWIMVEAWQKLTSATAVESINWGLLVMACSGFVNWLVSNYLYRVAIATHSIALEADALHLRTDVYTSFGVLAGLLLIKITGWQLFDPLVAIAVALMIIKASWGLTRVAFMPLLDTALPSHEEELITTILKQYQNQGRLSGFHKLRTRLAGAERHIDVHVVLPGMKDLASAHDLSDEIERDIRVKVPNSSVLIHLEPCCNAAVRDCGACTMTAEKGNEPA